MPRVSQLMRHVEADLKAALRVKTFETIEGEPSEFLVAGYDRNPRARTLTTYCFSK